MMVAILDDYVDNNLMDVFSRKQGRGEVQEVFLLITNYCERFGSVAQFGGIGLSESQNAGRITGLDCTNVKSLQIGPARRDAPREIVE